MSEAVQSRDSDKSFRAALTNNNVSLQQAGFKTDQKYMLLKNLAEYTFTLSQDYTHELLEPLVIHVNFNRNGTFKYHRILKTVY